MLSQSSDKNYSEVCSLLELLLLNDWGMQTDEKVRHVESLYEEKLKIKNGIAKITIKRHPRTERRFVISWTKLSSYLLCGPARAPVVSPIPREPVASLSDGRVCVRACVNIPDLLPQNEHLPSQPSRTLPLIHKHVCKPSASFHPDYVVS